MPLTFIWTLRRPIRERILIGCLMGLGIFATATTIVRADRLRVEVEQTLFEHLYLAIWAKLELDAGIVAACAPCLKAPAEKFLRRLGILTSRASNAISKPSFVVSNAHHDLPLGQVSTVQLNGETGSCDGPSQNSDIKHSAQRDVNTIASESGEWEAERTKRSTKFQVFFRL
jgi:hypothetical protein